MRITVKSKLGMAFAAVIVLSTITAAIGVSSLASLNATIDDLLRGPVQRVTLANQIYTDLLAISRAERSALAAPTPEMAKHYDEEIVDFRKVLLTHMDQLDAIASASGPPEAGRLQSRHGHNTSRCRISSVILLRAIRPRLPSFHMDR